MYANLHVIFVKLWLEASKGRFVRLSKKIWTTFMAPRKLLFGMQLAFNLTKRNIEREKS